MALTQRPYKRRTQSRSTFLTRFDSSPISLTDILIPQNGIVVMKIAEKEFEVRPVLDEEQTGRSEATDEPSGVESNLRFEKSAHSADAASVLTDGALLDAYSSAVTTAAEQVSPSV